MFDADHVCGRAAEQSLSVQECPQPPPGPASHAGGAGTGAPTDRSRSLAIGRAVRGSRRDQRVGHCPCLPVFFSWLHFRQPRREAPHVAAHSSDHRIGSGLRPSDRWPAARGTSWPTLFTSSGRHIMRRPVRQAPSAASTRPPLEITAGRRAVIQRARRSWPPLVWASARLTDRMFMHRRRPGERPVLPRGVR